jgi:hypothetical protein
LVSSDRKYKSEAEQEERPLPNFCTAAKRLKRGCSKNQRLINSGAGFARRPFKTDIQV